MLQAQSNSNVTFLKAPVLEAISGVVHAFSTRRASSIEQDNRGTDVPLEEKGENVVEAIGLTGWPIGRLQQIHSNVFYRVDDKEFVHQVPEGDAAYTCLTRMGLEVRTADCVPILIADRNARAVAIAHAGWRGTSGGVVRKVVDAIVSDLGVSAADLAVALGPHIGVCCMEVGEEVLGAFSDLEIFESRPEWPKPHLNLAEANRRQLLDAGVLPDMIQSSPLCTRCRSDLFHSYRRDGGQAGRMFSVIGIEP